MALNSTVRGWSRAGGAATQLVVFLHGYGADGNDLIEIGRAWQPLLPDAAFVSPHAPEPCGNAPIGPAMVPADLARSERALGRRQRGGARARRFLDAELARRELPPSALALVGFSQGTMMALHVGLRRAAAPAAIVGYSGLLVVPPERHRRQFAAEIKSRRRCCWSMATATSSSRSQALFQAAQGLAALDVPVEWHISPGIGHGIDQEGLRHGGEFLARRSSTGRRWPCTAHSDLAW